MGQKRKVNVFYTKQLDKKWTKCIIVSVGNYHVKNLWPDQEAAEDAGFTSEEAFVVSGNADSNFTISNIEAHAVVALRFDRK